MLSFCLASSSRIIIATLLQYDPFSKVIGLLETELRVDGNNKVLLSYKTTTIAPTDSPGSLQLTTADIIGERTSQLSLLCPGETVSSVETNV